MGDCAECEGKKEPEQVKNKSRPCSLNTKHTTLFLTHDIRVTSLVRSESVHV